MNPPGSRTNDYVGLSLAIEARVDWRPPFHALAQKIIEALAGAAFREVLVPDGDDVDGIDFDRDIQHRPTHVRRLSQDKLQSCLVSGFRKTGPGLRRQLFVNKPPRAKQRAQ